MDTEPEKLQFLSFVDIFQEARNILQSWKRIFSGITLSLIGRNEQALEHAPVDSNAEGHIRDLLASEWTSFILFKAAYLVIVLVLSLLSTSRT